MYRKKMLLAYMLLTAVVLQAQNGNTLKNLVPVPVAVVEKQGTFTFKSTITITVSADDAMPVAKQLADALAVPTGYATSVKKGNGGQVHMVLLTAADNSIGNEGYKMSVSGKGVTVTANTPAGLFYGMQTLLQLLPPAIESKNVVNNINWSIPFTDITDQPAFKWRGLMFDVSRHFFTKAEVKRFIDDMVKYKYNMLHWHLTDDEGWRIEIKSLPELTKVGAWRVNREGKWANTGNPFPNEPKTYGGFYTQDDIKEVVQYAKERFVTILPEIDVPGHSLAALAAYPELSCNPGPYEVSAGGAFMKWFPGGHEGVIDNTLCPANEKVYAFLDKVFTEVAQLFPFEYIHMGGDETARNFWAKSEQVKILMQKENLEDLNEVQAYFVRRVEQIVNAKGKKLIGWDEILDGGLAQSAAVMSWRGMTGGIAAAKQGHKVVMTPYNFVYLDFVQGEPSIEAPVYANLRMQQAYKFEPVPDGVDANLVMGGQGNLWTEQLQRFRNVQYMLWPRAMALAECLWSPKEKKDWNSFIRRAEAQFPRLEAAATRYSRAIYDPVVSVKDYKGSPQVTIETEAPGLEIYYTIDETLPDNYDRKYTQPIIVPEDAMHLKLLAYKDGKPVGHLISLSMDELKKRANN